VPRGPSFQSTVSIRVITPEEDVGLVAVHDDIVGADGLHGGPIAKVLPVDLALIAPTEDMGLCVPGELNRLVQTGLDLSALGCIAAGVDGVGGNRASIPGEEDGFVGVCSRLDGGGGGREGGDEGGDEGEESDKAEESSHFEDIEDGWCGGFAFWPGIGRPYLPRGWIPSRYQRYSLSQCWIGPSGYARHRTPT
jgi:hypothetical protein